jgi:hypothetical protein
MKFTASCHCGKVKIEVVGTIDAAMECNCSICSKKGSLLWFVARDAMRVTSDKTHIGTYTFNKHVIHHHFCTHCGIHPPKARTRRATAWRRSTCAASTTSTSRRSR